MDIQPFTVQIPEADLVDLQMRLARTRWPDEIAGADWEYGTSLDYLHDLVRYCQEHFDWRAQERAINAFAHFRAAVDGVGIHFIHQRGTGPAPLPLIITHGWPGSFIELLKIVPLLSDPARYGGDARDAFDVVIPSLPGYGFSDRPSERGMHPFRIADLWAELMAGLGYQRFGAQGGDWGSSVATCLGFAHADMVVGIHLNDLPGSYAPCITYIIYHSNKKDTIALHMQPVAVLFHRYQGAACPLDPRLRGLRPPKNPLEPNPYPLPALYDHTNGTMHLN